MYRHHPDIFSLDSFPELVANGDTSADWVNIRETNNWQNFEPVSLMVLKLTDVVLPLTSFL